MIYYYIIFTADGIEIWVGVCDALDACSKGPVKRILLSPGEGRTVEALIKDVTAHAMRCELNELERIAVSVVVTYTVS
jgi:hypothetical protein